MVRQAPLDNQVLRVQHVFTYDDGQVRYQTEGPYAKIGPANARKKHAETEARWSRGKYGGRPHSVHSKVQVLRGEWAEFDTETSS